MGNCACNKALIHPHDAPRSHEEDLPEEETDERRICQVKVRITAKELAALVSQAETAEEIGLMLLNRGLAVRCFEVGEWNGGGGRHSEVKRLETIEEEEC